MGFSTTVAMVVSEFVVRNDGNGSCPVLYHRKEFSRVDPSRCDMVCCWFRIVGILFVVSLMESQKMTTDAKARLLSEKNPSIPRPRSLFRAI